MLFAVRDDDTSFFTRPQELEAAYGDLWSTVPVSLAVIPFDVPTFGRGQPDLFRQEGAGVSVAENGELVRRLRELASGGRVDLMLHGYNHLYKLLDGAPFNAATWVPEFVHAADKEAKLREGRSLLQELFGRPVNVFVPPSNTISVEGIRALGTVGLDLACASGVKALIEADPANFFWAARARLSRRFPYDRRRYARHRELLCHSLTPSCDWNDVCGHLAACAGRDGIFVVATHYWEREATNRGCGRPLRELLRELIERARSCGARFVSVTEAFS